MAKTFGNGLKEYLLLTPDKYNSYPSITIQPIPSQNVFEYYTNMMRCYKPYQICSMLQLYYVGSNLEYDEVIDEYSVGNTLFGNLYKVPNMDLTNIDICNEIQDIAKTLRTKYNCEFFTDDNDDDSDEDNEDG
jgi:hypothetical protein